MLKRVPEVIDYDATYKNVADDMSPLNVVLLQEVKYLPFDESVLQSFLKLDSKIQCLVNDNTCLAG